MGGKIAFVFRGTLIFAVVFIFFMIPESKGGTYIEMDKLWNVPPRKFASTQLLSSLGEKDENLQTLNDIIIKNLGRGDQNL
jgi:hypothetical protein